MIYDEKQHFIKSHIRARLFFNNTIMFYKIANLCPHFLSTHNGRPTLRVWVIRHLYSILIT